MARLPHAETASAFTILVRSPTSHMPWPRRQASWIRTRIAWLVVARDQFLGTTMKSTETTASSPESCYESEKVDLSGKDKIAAAVAHHGGIEKAIDTLIQCDAGSDTIRDRPTNERRRNRPININIVGSPRHRFTWTTPAAKELVSRLDKIARLDSTALLTGESGTGKTSVARMIHTRSRRYDRPFVPLNCASLPSELMDAEMFGHARGAFTGAVSDRPGRAEAADGGTLFLDEIGDLPLELQPKLLTFLQERTFYRIGDNQPRHVDARIIAATPSALFISPASEARVAAPRTGPRRSIGLRCDAIAGQWREPHRD